MEIIRVSLFLPKKTGATSPQRSGDQHKITCCQIKSRTRWDIVDKRVRLVLIDLYGNKSVQFGRKVKNDSWNSPPGLPYRGGCCADPLNTYEVEIFGESCASSLLIIPSIIFFLAIMGEVDKGICCLENILKIKRANEREIKQARKILLLKCFRPSYLNWFAENW